MTEYRQPNVRNGDEVLIRAKVHSSRARPELIVEFKNGDNLPIASVEIEKVSQYDLQPGDKIEAFSTASGSQHRVIGTVKSVIRDIPTPQVVYQIPGEWVLKTMVLREAKRIA